MWLTWCIIEKEIQIHFYERRFHWMNKYWRNDVIVNSEISFNRVSNGSKNFESICSCSVQRPLETCTNYEFTREQFRASQRLLRSKISINVFILWKMRSIFKKCSWLITSHITHKQFAQHFLRIILARKLFESIDSAVWIRITWMISLSRCFRRCDLTKNIKNLLEFYEFCNLTSSRLSF